MDERISKNVRNGYLFDILKKSLKSLVSYHVTSAICHIEQHLSCALPFKMYAHSLSHFFANLHKTQGQE